MLAFWSKSLVFHGENAGWRKGQKFFKGKVLDGPKSRGEAPPFQSVGFLGKMFGCVWHSMEKLLDGSRGTPSLMGGSFPGRDEDRCCLPARVLQGSSLRSSRSPVCP